MAGADVRKDVQTDQQQYGQWFTDEDIADGRVLRWHGRAAAAAPAVHQRYNRNYADEARLTHPNTRLGVAALSWVDTLTALITRKNNSA